MQRQANTLRSLIVALIVLATLGASSCQSSGGEREPDLAAAPEEQPDTNGDEVPTPAPTPTLVASVLDRVPLEPYLPTALPDGYVLESITWIDEPEEIRTADALASDSLILGDSPRVSDISALISARRFETQADLERAQWVEDALMVQGGGPTRSFAVGDASFAYDRMDGPAGTEMSQFHGVVDGVLVSGLVFGAMSESGVAQLVSTLTVDPDSAALDIDAASAGLEILQSGAPSPSFGGGYDLTYSNEGDRFSISVYPGSPEATLAMGSLSREGDRFDGDVGSGFLESQPEVGGALGSRRLLWWVSEARVQIWFGGTEITDDLAVSIADSFEPVTEQQWSDAVADVAADVLDFGPMNLPEDPQATFQERLAERDRAPDEIGARPDLDIAAITAFVADFRGGELPADARIEWLAPLEADVATSGMNLFPADIEQVHYALRLIRRSARPGPHAEARRQDVRGICCGLGSIQLVEGMEEGEAAVVAAHEFTHLLDTSLDGMTFASTTELMNPTAALLEGNATRVMLAYRDTNEIRYDPDLRPHLQLDMASAVRRTLRFAYHDGLEFTTALAAAGGEQAIDQAFQSPPTTTEHILHPDHYLAGDVPIQVDSPEPPSGADVDQRATLGAFVIALAVERELGWEQAVELAGAWAGDSFVAWSDGAVDCVAAAVVFDDPSSAAAFAAALHIETETQVAGTTVDLRSCG